MDKPLQAATSDNITLDDSNYDPKTKHNIVSSFNYSPKHSIIILVICLTILLFFQIPSLKNKSSTITMSNKKSDDNPESKLRISNDPESKLAKSDDNPGLELSKSDDPESKLRKSVTFLPLKDLRYSKTALEGHTWFMSTMYDTQDEEGEVQYQKFPSNASNGRVLCLKGHDKHDGSWNYYALAWPKTLPYNATIMKGLTFVSYNHYNYDNIWHGLSSIFPFVAWHVKNECELRTHMSLWLSLLLEATFGTPINIEGFNGIKDDQPVCFEEAMVMRHNEGGMSRERRMETYDHMRCKARLFCNITHHDVNNNEIIIGLTLFMREGPRSFKNETIVVDIFKKECDMFKGCRFLIAYSNNLTFCDQVKIMEKTDVLISPHGAQLTNMFLMNRNSSVMEFFPKGWLKLAGVGQYVYHWIASWSGMIHRGAYRDPIGDPCPYPEDDRRCWPIFKNGKIGLNETYFREWVRNVLNDVKLRKLEGNYDRSLKFGRNSCNCC
ncbi:hypothetical protein RND81_11G142500 [Saponaria officinalis]|uniref:Glycosyltransferase 61 catalytic domain-containing protein n=1 Tax=Saponaria officinalis TaxID=3572 RepID=A0AAW1HLT7_SAPOF